jgi:hypothetical protein
VYEEALGRWRLPCSLSHVPFTRLRSRARVRHFILAEKRRIRKDRRDGFVNIDDIPSSSVFRDGFVNIDDIPPVFRLPSSSPSSPPPSLSPPDSDERTFFSLSIR